MRPPSPSRWVRAVSGRSGCGRPAHGSEAVHGMPPKGRPRGLRNPSSGCSGGRGTPRGRRCAGSSVVGPATGGVGAAVGVPRRAGGAPSGRGWAGAEVERRRCTGSLGGHREHGCAPGVPWLHLPQAVPTRGGRCLVEPPVLRGRVRAGPWSQRCPSRESRQRVRREAMRAMTPRAAMSVPQAWAVWCHRGSSSRPMVRPRRSMVEAPAA